MSPFPSAMVVIDEDDFETQLADLEAEKKNAMMEEDFERCALIRDEINEVLHAHPALEHCGHACDGRQRQGAKTGGGTGGGGACR